MGLFLSFYRAVVEVELLFRPPPLALAEDEVVECNGDRSLNLRLYCLAPEPLGITSDIVVADGLVGDVCTLVDTALAFGSARNTVCGGMP
jgi:hypothetical protein